MTKPKTSDQNTEWIMPRGTERRASRRLFRRVRRGIEARDRVERVEKADEEGHQCGARHRHVSAAGITRVVHECRETGEIPACTPDQEHRRKHDRNDQDEVAGEVCQQRGQLDAEMIDQRLRCNDQGYGTDLHIVGVVIDGIDLVESHSRRKWICRLRRPRRDIDVKNAGNHQVSEQLPHTNVD